MFTIEFTPSDLSDLPKGIDMDALDALVGAVAAFALDTWRAAVSGAVMPGMRRPLIDHDYARSLRLEHNGPTQWSITTNYSRALTIERGVGSYDMKPFLLAGPNARQLKSGLGTYNVVPFRFFTQGKGGSVRPTATAEMTLPRDIHEYTKRAGVYNGDEGGRSKIPLFLYEGKPASGTNAQALLRGAAAPMSAPYTWKSGQYEGLTKVQTAGGANRYFTFRGVSTRRLEKLPDGRAVWRGSDPNSWIHPGVPANPVQSAVEDYVLSRAHRLMSDALLVENR